MIKETPDVCIIFDIRKTQKIPGVSTILLIIARSQALNYVVVRLNILRKSIRSRLGGAFRAFYDMYVAVGLQNSVKNVGKNDVEATEGGGAH